MVLTGILGALIDKMTHYLNIQEMACDTSAASTFSFRSLRISSLVSFLLSTLSLASLISLTLSMPTPWLLCVACPPPITQPLMGLEGSFLVQCASIKDLSIEKRILKIAQ